MRQLATSICIELVEQRGHLAPIRSKRRGNLLADVAALADLALEGL
jgi:hypothetical protein